VSALGWKPGLRDNRRMRSGPTGTTWVVVGAAALMASACGGESAFKPAMMPSDVCALLTQADAQTILPTAAPGSPQTNAQTVDYWDIACFWPDSSSGSGQDVGLTLSGALTSEGARQLDDALTRGPNTGNAPAVTVNDLGDRAAYINNPGSAQTLNARVGNYLVDVTAQNITADVAEGQLRPLVAKAIAAL
jgi:hypothetical protein